MAGAASLKTIASAAWMQQCGQFDQNWMAFSYSKKSREWHQRLFSIPDWLWTEIGYRLATVHFFFKVRLFYICARICFTSMTFILRWGKKINTKRLAGDGMDHCRCCGACCETGAAVLRGLQREERSVGCCCPNLSTARGNTKQLRSILQRQLCEQICPSVESPRLRSHV